MSTTRRTDDDKIAVQVTVGPELRATHRSHWQETGRRELALADAIAADFYIRFGALSADPHDSTVEWAHGDGEIQLADTGWALPTTAYIDPTATPEVEAAVADLFAFARDGKVELESADEDARQAWLRLDAVLCEFLDDHLAEHKLAGKTTPCYGDFDPVDAASVLGRSADPEPVRAPQSDHAEAARRRAELTRGEDPFA